jgi:hypothetical protein
VTDLLSFLTERLNADEAGAMAWGACDEPIPLGLAVLTPSRVLAEVAAKRLLLKWHYPDGGECAECMALAWPCNTILALCSVYQDHPAYRPEWRL